MCRNAVTSWNPNSATKMDLKTQEINSKSSRKEDASGVPRLRGPAESPKAGRKNGRAELYVACGKVAIWRWSPGRGRFEDGHGGVPRCHGAIKKQPFSVVRKSGDLAMEGWGHANYGDPLSRFAISVRPYGGPRELWRGGPLAKRTRSALIFIHAIFITFFSKNEIQISPP